MTDSTLLLWLFAANSIAQIAIQVQLWRLSTAVRSLGFAVRRVEDGVPRVKTLVITPDREKPERSE